MVITAGVEAKTKWAAKKKFKKLVKKNHPKFKLGHIEIRKYKQEDKSNLYLMSGDVKGVKTK